MPIEPSNTRAVGPPIIVPYNPAWPSRFEEEAARIRDALGDVAVRIEHVGSTAVPGLAAKERSIYRSLFQEWIAASTRRLSNRLVTPPYGIWPPMNTTSSAARTRHGRDFSTFTSARSGVNGSADSLRDRRLATRSGMGARSRAVRMEGADIAQCPWSRKRKTPGATFRRVPLGDAGGEHAEIIGQGADGKHGNACAQSGDDLARGEVLEFA
jgi:hypothetical protein